MPVCADLRVGEILQTSDAPPLLALFGVCLSDGNLQASVSRKTHCLDLSLSMLLATDDGEIDRRGWLTRPMPLVRCIQAIATHGQRLGLNLNSSINVSGPVSRSMVPAYMEAQLLLTPDAILAMPFTGITAKTAP